VAEPLKVLLVDDEAPARAKLRRLIKDDSRVAVAGEAADGLAAVEQVQALRPDLLVLDIQMPGLTGFEVLEALEKPRPLVIFSTAYDRFALDAFEAAAVDYLLKPYDAARFAQALDRALALRRSGPDPVKALLDRVARAPLERLLVKDGERWFPVPLRAVRRLSADGKTVKVHAESGVHVVRRSLAELERCLDPRRFVRVHRGDLVALEAVAHLEPWDHGDALLVLKDGTHVVLSRTYRAAFLARWGVEG
jgi:two-component system LytT family response regulator